MLFPKTKAVISDVWQVVGLKGTGSDTYTVTDLFVPARYTFTRESVADRRETGPLYRFTTYQIFGAAFAGCCARHRSGDARRLHPNRDDQGADAGSKPLRDNPVVQSQGRGRPRQNGNPHARYLMQTLETCGMLHPAVRALTLQQRAALRLAAVHASHQAKEVVETAYHFAGGTAIFENQAFERRLRDIHAVTQQVQSQFVKLRGRRTGSARAAGHVETDLMPDIDKQSPAGTYDPATHWMLGFHERWSQIPRRCRHAAGLSRALHRDASRRSSRAVMAFAFLNLDRARKAADESGARYKAGKPLERHRRHAGRHQRPDRDL